MHLLYFSGLPPSLRKCSDGNREEEEDNISFCIKGYICSSLRNSWNLPGVNAFEHAECSAYGCWSGGRGCGEMWRCLNVMNFKTCPWGKINRNALTHLQKSMRLVRTVFTDKGQADSSLGCARCWGPRAWTVLVYTCCPGVPPTLTSVLKKLPWLCCPIVSTVRIQISRRFCRKPSGRDDCEGISRTLLLHRRVFRSRENPPNQPALNTRAA